MRNIIQSLLLLILFFSVTYFTGCVPSKPTEDIEILPADRLVKKLEVNRRKIKSFEGVGTLHLNTTEIQNSTTFRVVLSKPDSVYVTFFGPFGIELAQILISKQNFVFYESLNNTAYEGNINDNILKSIFKIDISLTDLVDAFIGSVNMSERLYKEPDYYKIDYDKYILTYLDSLKKTSATYVIDVRDLGISEFTLRDAKNNPTLEGKYSSFGILESVAVPYKISLKNNMRKQALTIEYNSIQVNKRNIFIDFNIPDDADRVRF